MIGYQTPNIERIANEGAIFTNVCAQQSCTAGRAAFILGQSPFRTGLLTIGVPGSPQGTPIERSHSPPTKVASIPPIESRWLGRSSSISGPTLRSAPHDSGVYVRWYADLLWLFVPIQGKIAELGAMLKEYPPVTGGSLSGGLNCKAVQIQNAVDQLESLSTSRN